MMQLRQSKLKCRYRHHHQNHWELHIPSHIPLSKIIRVYFFKNHFFHKNFSGNLFKKQFTHCTLPPKHFHTVYLTACSKGQLHTLTIRITLTPDYKQQSKIFAQL